MTKAQRPEPPRIETIAIGDELLVGKIADTNSAFVAAQLFARGTRLFRSTVIADSVDELHATMRLVASRSQFAIVFGGLGPTSDDKTADAVAKLLGCGLVTSPAAQAHLDKVFRERRRDVTPQALKQVVYPETSEALPNPEGFAVPFAVTWSGCRFYFLPGVPQEMRVIVKDSVIADLDRHSVFSADGKILARTWRCLGIPESELQRVMDPVEAELPSTAWLGYRTRFPENHLTLYFRTAKSVETDEFARFESRIRKLLAPWAYDEGERELEQIVLEQLEGRRWKIALAESCTGGLVAQRFTRIPGASESFWGGATVYRIEAKHALLGVRVASHEAAVSSGCTRQLAESVRSRSGCDVAAAVTGFLGPSGGTADSPIGTIYTCVITSQEIREAKFFQPSRDREQAQWSAATHLLNEIRKAISGDSGK